MRCKQHDSAPMQYHASLRRHQPRCSKDSCKVSMQIAISGGVASAQALYIGPFTSMLLQLRFACPIRLFLRTVPSWCYAPQLVSAEQTHLLLCYMQRNMPYQLVCMRGEIAECTLARQIVLQSIVSCKPSQRDPDADSDLRLVGCNCSGAC